MAHAAPLLERYRYTHLVFNDDIQGTATCAVGGVYGAMAVQGAPCALLWAAYVSLWLKHSEPFKCCCADGILHCLTILLLGVEVLLMRCAIS